MDETDIEQRLNDYVIEADKYKLPQVMRNFVSNAIKFTPEGGIISVKVHVTNNSILRRSVTEQLSIRSMKSKKILRVEVRDTGCGIAKVSVS